MPFQRLLGIVPLGIGLTVLGGIWFSDFGPFGGPPLFFKFFISFIAIAFILQGLSTLTVADMMTSGSLHDLLTKQLNSNFKPQNEPEAKKTGQYECSNCNAPLVNQADVSPLGDVRCKHCGKWFNIHGRNS